MDLQEIWAQLRETSTQASSPRSELAAPHPTNPESGPESETAAEPQVPKPRLLDQVRRTMRVAYYAIRTEQAYVDWIRRFILYHNKRHPNEMGAVTLSLFGANKSCEPHLLQPVVRKTFGKVSRKSNLGDCSTHRFLAQEG